MPQTVPTLQLREWGPDEDVRGAVIWMHGLGASSSDFDPLLPLLGLPDVRFVFPQAPTIPVTLNGGYRMPAWYDIRTLEPGPDREDEAGIRASAWAITELIHRENARGIPCDRIVLAGFSQGAAMALHVALRHPVPLAGVVVLSGYLLVPDTLEEEASPANAATPMLFCHGTIDEVVTPSRGKAAYERVARGRSALWHTDPVGHTIGPGAIPTLRNFLDARFDEGTRGECSP
jgi:phospholipase/carboxylesterase